jgi:hypothetical protein
MSSEPLYTKNTDGSWMDFDQIVEDLYGKLSEKELDEALKMTEGQMRGLHHGFGTWIRNTYGLWNPEHPLTTNWANNEAGRDIRDGTDYSKDHPDAVSNDILAALWHRCQPATGMVPQ